MQQLVFVINNQYVFCHITPAQTIPLTGMDKRRLLFIAALLLCQYPRPVQALAQCPEPRWGIAGGLTG
jgi:hypothetical protein